MNMSSGATGKQTDTMAQGIMALDGTASNIRNVGVSVADARSSLAGFWTGGASQQYGNALDVWLQDLQEILRNMDNLRETLAGVDKQFTATESDNAQSAYQWVTNALGGK